MRVPSTIRIERIGAGSSYRDAGDAERRVVWARGSSPARATVPLALAATTVLVSLGWLAAHGVADSGLVVVPGLLSLVVVAHLGPLVAWRALQRARFEIARRELTVETRPLGAKVCVPGWSARAPVMVRRESAWGRPWAQLPSWSVYAERDDGRRELLATLYDEASARSVRELLAESYSDAEQTVARNPFAVRFGPIPDGVTCEGDPEVAGSTWRLELRCARGPIVRDALTLFALSVVATTFLVSTVTALTERGPVLLTAFLSLVAAWLVSAFFAQLRTFVLRLAGRVQIELADQGVEISSTPWPLRSLPPRARRTPGPVSARVVAHRRRPNEASLELTHAARAHRLHAPLALDDARYAARIIAAYEQARVG